MRKATKDVAPWLISRLSTGGKTKAAVSVANLDGAVQCMDARENEELNRQEGQTDSAGKERGNAVGTGSGPSMECRYAH
jgi:hypothetical protein